MQPTSPNPLKRKEFDEGNFQDINKKTKLNHSQEKILAVANQNLDPLNNFLNNNNIHKHHFLHITNEDIFKEHTKNLEFLKTFRTKKIFINEEKKFFDIVTRYKDYEPRLLMELINQIINNIIPFCFNLDLKKNIFDLLTQLDKAIDLNEFNQKQNFTKNELYILNTFLSSLIALEIELENEFPEKSSILSKTILNYLLNTNEFNPVSFEHIFKEKVREIEVSDKNIAAMLKHDFNSEKVLEHLKKLIPWIPFELDYVRSSAPNGEKRKFAGIILHITEKTSLNELQNISLYLHQFSITFFLNFIIEESNQATFDFIAQIKNNYKRIKKFNYTPLEELIEEKRKKEYENLLNAFLSQCVNLEILKITSQIIDDLPSIEFLKKLRIINLKNCSQLKHLSFHSFNFPFLNRLYLEGCTQLTTLPQFENTPNLEVCDFENCKSLKNITNLNIKCKYLNFFGCTNLTFNDKKFLYQYCEYYDVKYTFDGLIKKVIESDDKILQSDDFKLRLFATLKHIEYDYTDPYEVIDLNDHTLFDIIDRIFTPFNGTPKKLIFIEMLLITKGSEEIKELLKSFYLIKINDARKTSNPLEFNEKIVNNRFFNSFLKRKLKKDNDYFSDNQLILALDLIINLKNGNENNPNYEMFSTFIYQLVEKTWINIKLKSNNTVDRETNSNKETNSLTVQEADRAINSVNSFFSTSDGIEMKNLLKDQLKNQAPNFYNDLFMKIDYTENAILQP